MLFQKKNTFFCFQVPLLAAPFCPAAPGPGGARTAHLLEASTAAGFAAATAAAAAAPSFAAAAVAASASAKQLQGRFAAQRTVPFPCSS